MSNRNDCLDYPRALALGLAIGSGMIESGHRHVLPARRDKAGSAWLHDHADQIPHLRVLRADRLWRSLLELTSPAFNRTGRLCSTQVHLTSHGWSWMIAGAANNENEEL